jgi:hypothetical protein
VPTAGSVPPIELEAWKRWWKTRGQRELRELLIEHWDPVKVKSVPEAQDEYDDYASGVGRRLQEGADAKTVAGARAGPGRSPLPQSRGSRRLAVTWAEVTPTRLLPGRLGSHFLRLTCDQTPAKRPQNAPKLPKPDSAPIAESGL